LLFVAVICGALTGLAATAGAAPERHLEGRVTAAEARWTDDGRRIVTDLVVTTPEGEQVAVRQTGGTVDGVGMRVIHAPPLLRAGDQVSVLARPAADRKGQTTLRLATVLELERDDRLPFVRTTNATGAPLYWDSSCVFITYAEDGTDHLAGDAEFAIMDEVFATWRAGIESCSYLTFELEGRADIEVGFDGINIIKLRDDRWCRPATDDEEEECYDQGAAGLTTLFFIDDAESDHNGQIFDADIELNGVNFALSADGQSLGDAPCKADLANTLTHEVGHLMGLDHTCHVAGERPVDDQGEPVPDCFPASLLSAEIKDATMYTFQDCGETKKITPEPDDLAGVCAIYPLGAAPSCQRPELDPGCCQLAPHRRGGPPLGTLALAGLVFWLTLRVAARRRDRRGARSSAPR
jgi:hypothetical protein